MAKISANRIRQAASAQKRGRNGFTIIELLASMAILIFIVMMMTRMFAEATNIWSLGTKQISSATEGRAIMDFIVKEMTQAIADDTVAFMAYTGKGNFGEETVFDAEPDEICFVGMVRSGSADYPRTANQFVYYITKMIKEADELSDDDSDEFRYQLVRRRKTDAMWNNGNNRDQSAYKNLQWWNRMDNQPIEIIAENVIAFEMWKYDSAGNLIPGDYNSNDQGGLLPLWADLYLEILGEEDAKRASILWKGGDKNLAFDFISRNVKRYNATIFFPNRERALAWKP